MFILNQCTTPGTALLSPVITGAKTGSVYQASLSYGTGKIMNKISDLNNLLKTYNVKIDFFQTNLYLWTK